MQEPRIFKHHPIPYNRFRYPVGENMMDNEHAFRELIDRFIDHAKEDITTYSKVNLICMGSSGSIVSTMMYLALRLKYPTLNVQIITSRRTRRTLILASSREYLSITRRTYFTCGWTTT